jgi:hypothetical protein
VWLHEKTSQKTFPKGLGERTSHSILQLSEDIGDAIIVLLEAKLPGPALSLARPLFEGYVRGFWLLNCASDNQVSELRNGKCPNLRNLLTAIPKDADSGGPWIQANSEKILICFHDLTTADPSIVKRRDRDEAVEPSYPEEELESLIHFVNEVRIRIGAELLSRLNDEKAIEELQGWTQGFRATSMKLLIDYGNMESNWGKGVQFPFSHFDSHHIPIRC